MLGHWRTQQESATDVLNQIDERRVKLTQDIDGSVSSSYNLCFC